SLLNYGHTFGHALETALGYGRLLHGYGVALGSALCAKLALRLSRRGDERFKEIDESWIIRQNDLIAKLGLPNSLSDIANLTEEEIDLSPRRLVDLMASDKKTEYGKLNFVLPVGLGKCSLIRNVSVDDVVATLE
ncbi:MAG: hypothetical protein J6X44_03360, partial [Thermoguttaceae bacterium]|nr:hypothetical protein [Thermoguttaceae bacterium]